MSKSVRALIDTGASHSMIALPWLKYLKLEHQMKKTKKKMVDAQKTNIPILGKVVLPVEVGNKTFEWKFTVIETLVCLMIIGMNILEKAIVKLKSRKVKIENQTIPICINMEELKQNAIVSTINKVMQPYTITPVEGRIVKNGVDKKNVREVNQYIINSKSNYLNDQLVESFNKEDKRTKENIEYVQFLLINETPIKLQVMKGDILAFAEQLSIDEVVTVSALTEQIAMQNLERLVKSFSIDNALEQKKSCISQLALLNRPIKTNININENAQNNHPRRKEKSESVQGHSCKQRKQEHAVVDSGLKSYNELDPTRTQKNDLLNELDRSPKQGWGFL